MKCLVIHAPNSAVEPGTGSRAFEQIYSSGIGRDYVISKTELAQLQPGISCVILLSNPEEKRAHALLEKLVPVNTPAPPGKQRFNVHFEKPKMQKYQMIRVNRFGIAIMDCQI